MGPPAFVEILHVDTKKLDAKIFPRVSPLIVQDLNRDGAPEIILAGSNLIYQKKKTGFEHRPFLSHPVTPIGEAGILSDFDGDGKTDFISTGLEDGLLRIWIARCNGQFTSEPRIALQEMFDNPHTMTAADIDLDGDLDLFVGQWKQPYLKGSMPTPYYDANDGYPDALLINDGKVISRMALKTGLSKPSVTAAHTAHHSRISMAITISTSFVSVIFQESTFIKTTARANSPM